MMIITKTKIFQLNDLMQMETDRSTYAICINRGHFLCFDKDSLEFNKVMNALKSAVVDGKPFLDVSTYKYKERFI